MVYIISKYEYYRYILNSYSARQQEPVPKNHGLLPARSPLEMVTVR